MGLITRDLTVDDAVALAALMLRIEADHPTGFCLAAGEVRELMRDKPDASSRAPSTEPTSSAFTTVIPARRGTTGTAILLFGDVAPDAPRRGDSGRR